MPPILTLAKTVTHCTSRLGLETDELVRSIKHQDQTLVRFSTFQCSSVLFTASWGPLLRFSPALLVGSPAHRRPMPQYSHVAVFGHDTLTFPEHRPLGREGPRHQALHEWSSEVSRRIRERPSWTSHEPRPLHVSGSQTWSPEGSAASVAVMHHIIRPKHSLIQISPFSVFWW